MKSEKSYSHSPNFPSFSPRSNNLSYSSIRSFKSKPEGIDLKILTQHINTGNTPSVKNPIKRLVSKNKRRYQWDGYNLDLTYITNNILAMGFPSENLQSLYRNSLIEVQNFLEQKHKGKYKVYNLCQQKCYAEEKFYGKFVEYPFEDHNAPPFELIYRCCADIKRWLEVDEANVAAIHCKAGKGRTGIIISCFLLYIGMFLTAEECLKHYADVRTIDSKGVTIRSQIRYVKYFQNALKMGFLSQVEYFSKSRKIKIVKVKMSHCPWIHIFGGCTPWVSIITANKEFRSKYSDELVTYSTDEKIQIPLKMPFSIERDFKVTFFTKGKVIKKSEQIMRIWLNCVFMPNDSIKLTLSDMDGVKPDDKRFNKNFVAQIIYKEI